MIYCIDYITKLSYIKLFFCKFWFAPAKKRRKAKNAMLK